MKFPGCPVKIKCVDGGEIFMVGGFRFLFSPLAGRLTANPRDGHSLFQNVHFCPIAGISISRCDALLAMLLDEMPDLPGKNKFVIVVGLKVAARRC